MSLRTRVAVLAALAVGVVVAGATAAVYVVVDQRQQARVENTLSSRLDRFLALSPEQRRVLADRLGDALPDDAVAPLLSDAQLVGPDGTVSTPEGARRIPVTDAVRELAAGRRTDRVVYETRRGRERVQVMAVPAGDLGAAMAAQSLREADGLLRDVLIACLAVGAVGCLLAALAGWLVARRGLAPLDAFVQRLEGISRTRDLGRRLPEGGPAEIDRLAHAQNATLAALEASVRAQRQLVADASHELRSPLAAIQANLHLLRDRDGRVGPDADAAAQDAADEGRALGALVGDLIDLARDGRDTLVEEDLRLDLLVADLVERTRRGGVEIGLRAAMVRVVADEAAIARAVGNLLDNAIKYSPAGGRVEVEVGADGVVAVRDHGPGIASEDLPRVFDRFYRSRRTAEVRGSGLGLAIVRRIADAHGAGVAAENAPGGGARFTLDLSGRVVAPSGAGREPARLRSDAGAGGDDEHGVA